VLHTPALHQASPAQIYICIYTYIHRHRHRHISALMYVHTSVYVLYTHMRVCIRMRRHTQMRVDIHTFIQTDRQTDTCTYIYTYIHTCILTHTRTHRHVYTHTDRHTRGPHSQTARHGGSSNNAFMPCNLLSNEISFLSHPVIAPPPAPPRPSTSAATPAPPSGWPSAPPTFVCVRARVHVVCVCVCV
jgi:hypothetical protein